MTKAKFLKNENPDLHRIIFLKSTYLCVFFQFNKLIHPFKFVSLIACKYLKIKTFTSKKVYKSFLKIYFQTELF